MELKLPKHHVNNSVDTSCSVLNLSQTSDVPSSNSPMNVQESLKQSRSGFVQIIHLTCSANTSVGNFPSEPYGHYGENSAHCGFLITEWLIVAN